MNNIKQETILIIFSPVWATEIEQARHFRMEMIIDVPFTIIMAVNFLSNSDFSKPGKKETFINCCMNAIRTDALLAGKYNDLW